MAKISFDIYDLEGKLFDSDLLSIHLILNNICNQKCYYCLCNNHPENIKMDTPFTYEQFDKVVDFIRIQDKKYLEFYFFGGEPTLHPHLNDFINILEKEFGEKLLNVNIITNFTKPEEYFKNLNRLVNLTLSLHTVECKDYDAWFQKAINLKDRINILKIILSHNNLDDVLYLCKKYSSYFNKDQFEIQMIYQLEENYIKEAELVLSDYVLTDGDDTVRLISDKTNIVIDNNKIDKCNYKNYKNYKNFQGMMCKTGFWILENGNVLKCSKDIVKNPTPLINIFNDEIKKLENWWLCTHTNCNCEEGCPKISIKKYLELFKNGR